MIGAGKILIRDSGESAHADLVPVSDHSRGMVVVAQNSGVSGPGRLVHSASVRAVGVHSTAAAVLAALTYDKEWSFSRRSFCLTTWSVLVHWESRAS